MTPASEPTPDVVEAVAKALREQSPDQHEFTWHAWMNDARAAITAYESARGDVKAGAEAEFRAKCEQFARPASDVPAEQTDRVLTVLDARMAWTFAHDSAHSHATATTVEELEELFWDLNVPGVALRDNHGEPWVVWCSEDNDLYARSYPVEGDDEELDVQARLGITPVESLAFPVTVLTPAPAPRATVTRGQVLEVLNRSEHAPMSDHDPRDGSCRSCPWPLHELSPEEIADAIMALLTTPTPDAKGGAE